MAEIYWPFSRDTVSEWPGVRPPGWGYHVGTDFAVPQGTNLRATMAGTVDIHWTDGLGAWVIDIINPDGTVVRNGHLSYMAVGDGEWVNAGDYIGNTGGAAGTPGAGLSTGPHLHWEIRNSQAWNGPGWYDPRDLSVHNFSELDKPTEPTNPPLHGMEDAMIIYYENGAGKGTPAWLVLGYTPNALILTSQSSANLWAGIVGRNAQAVGRAAFINYLGAAGASVKQITNVG